ncbi:hypothetical protein ABIF23_001076 [Bradyrhizobium elkanii]
MGEGADWIETDVAPQLEPNLVTDAVEDGRFHARGREQLGKFLDVGCDLAGGLAQRKVVAVDVADHAGRLNFGGGVNHAADGAFGTQLVPLPTARIDALERRSLVPTTMLVEIPIGNAVDGGDDAGPIAQQRSHRLDDAGDRMRLEANDDVILLAEFGGAVGTTRMHDALLVADQELQAVLPHCGEMRAACDQADIGASAHQFDTEIAADRTGAVDADSHEILASRMGTQQEPQRLEPSSVAMALGKSVRPRRRLPRKQG